MTDGSLVTISPMVLAVVAVSALAVTATRSWRDAQRHGVDVDGPRRAEARLRAQVRSLEARIAALTNELEARRRWGGADALRAPANPWGDPPGQVAPLPAQCGGAAGARRGGVAAPANVILFPGPERRRARR
jgi:hypothetical protein